MQIPHFLMCPPDFFAVRYIINPWMEGKFGTTENMLAKEQWNRLYSLLTETVGVTVTILPPHPAQPDIVFTANAAAVRNGIAVPSHFRHPERQGEEPFYRAFLEQEGFSLRDLPSGIAFEGAGDALFDESRENESPVLYAAYGFRTDTAALPFLADVFEAEIVPLALVDPRFYHLDTCFCPLPDGYLIWYPPALDLESQQRIVERIPAARRYAVSEADATGFACNAIGIAGTPAADRVILMNTTSAPLLDQLRNWGFAVYTTPLTEFMKAGGSAKCLSLRLNPV